MRALTISCISLALLAACGDKKQTQDSDFWPSDGDQSVFELTLEGEPTGSIDVTVHEDVDWKGGTWTMIEVGDAEPGKAGAAFYLDKSVPGAIGVKGYALYIPYQPAFADKEQWLNEPLTVSLTQDVGETRSHQVEVITAYDGGYENDGFEVPYTVAVSLLLRELEPSQSLPIGDLDGVLELSVREDGLGFEPTEWTIWLHPEHFVVKIEGDHGTVAMNQTWE